MKIGILKPKEHGSKLPRPGSLTAYLTAFNMKKPEIRYLNDIKDVLYDKEWTKKAPNLELYYMYRGVEKKGGCSNGIGSLRG